MQKQQPQKHLNKLNFKVLKGLYSVCHLNSTDKVPTWINECEFYSITRTEEELSIVCIQENIPLSVQAEKNWKIFKIDAKLDFSMIGIISKISTMLAENSVSVFVISTFDTDYVLVKQENFDKTIKLLDTIGKVNF